jgi:hypothetical protein
MLSLHNFCGRGTWHPVYFFYLYTNVTLVEQPYLFMHQKDMGTVGEENNAERFDYVK